MTSGGQLQTVWCCSTYSGRCQATDVVATRDPSKAADLRRRGCVIGWRIRHDRSVRDASVRGWTRLLLLRRTRGRRYFSTGTSSMPRKAGASTLTSEQRRLLPGSRRPSQGTGWRLRGLLVHRPSLDPRIGQPSRPPTTGPWRPRPRATAILATLPAPTHARQSGRVIRRIRRPGCS